MSDEQSGADVEAAKLKTGILRSRAGLAICATIAAICLLVMIGHLAPWPRIVRTESKPERWTRLSDGSILSKPITDRFYSVARCWPVQGRYDCLNAFVDGNSVSAYRYSSSTASTDFSLAAGGYSCVLVDQSYREAISKAAGSEEIALTSNLVEVIDYVSEASKFWTRDFVVGYMAKNRVEGSAYFNCPYVMALISRGSFLSIGTSDLTYATMRGLDEPGKSKISTGSDEPLSELGVRPSR